MHRMTSKLRMALSAVLGVLTVGALAGLSAPASASSTDTTAPAPEVDVAPLGCTNVQTVGILMRNVTLWNCNGRFHGEIRNASAGDVVWLAPSASGVPIETVVPPGATSANTPDSDYYPEVDACASVQPSGAWRCTCIRC